MYLYFLLLFSIPYETIGEGRKGREGKRREGKGRKGKKREEKGREGVAGDGASVRRRFTLRSTG